MIRFALLSATTFSSLILDNLKGSVRSLSGSSPLSTLPDVIYPQPHEGLSSINANRILQNPVHDVPRIDVETVLLHTMFDSSWTRKEVSLKPRVDTLPQFAFFFHRGGHCKIDVNISVPTISFPTVEITGDTHEQAVKNAVGCRDLLFHTFGLPMLQIVETEEAIRDYLVPRFCSLNKKLISLTLPPITISATLEFQSLLRCPFANPHVVDILWSLKSIEGDIPNDWLGIQGSDTIWQFMVEDNIIGRWTDAKETKWLPLFSAIPSAFNRPFNEGFAHSAPKNKCTAKALRRAAETELYEICIFASDHDDDMFGSYCLAQYGSGSLAFVRGKNGIAAFDCRPRGWLERRTGDVTTAYKSPYHTETIDDLQVGLAACLASRTGSSLSSN